MEQAELIWEGKHIADRIDGEHNVLLYKVDDLYVEVFHREYNVKRKFAAFSKNELLDIYLSKN
ncbi:MAG TPA: hypothetical protein VGP55_03755 [Chitinophagaceae bacterium]|nr:hypothetical protein [Chitinophagaceae bacterium]